MFKKDNEKVLNKIHNSEKYRQNQLQIDCIKKVLTERADVPVQLLDWLIASVIENTELESKAITL